MEMKQNQSLLDLLAESADCTCLSDLRSIKKPKRQQLADKLERISPEVHSLAVWNDALAYLISAPPQQTPEVARKLLIDHYRNQEEIPLSNFPKGGNEYEKT